MMKCLDGVTKTVLITGASRGLGKAIAALMSYNNYELILCCNETDIEETENIDVVRGDLRKEQTLLNIVEKVKDRNGIDIFVNNAGQYLNKPFGNSSVGSIEEIRRIVEVNLIAPMILTNLLWPLFKKCGLIININSLAGKTGSRDEVVYSASKHGLKGFSEALQYDATKAGIKIIDIFSGAIDTDMARHKENKRNLIQPVNVASLILRICEDYPSLRITELTICRAKY